MQRVGMDWFMGVKIYVILLLGEGEVCDGVINGIVIVV